MSRILVVDDEPDVLAAISMLLSIAGHDVHTAHDGEAAWDILQSEPHDLVVTDLLMPRLDGVDLCKRIRSHGSLRDVPVILVSARTDLSRDAGLFDRYFAKPADFRTLLEAVAELLRARPKH